MIGERNVAEASDRADAGIVDPDVDVPVSRDRRAFQRFNPSGIADVGQGRLMFYSLACKIVARKREPSA